MGERILSDKGIEYVMRIDYGQNQGIHDAPPIKDQDRDVMKFTTKVYGMKHQPIIQDFDKGETHHQDLQIIIS